MPGTISICYMIREYNYKTPDQAVAAIIVQAEKDINWISRFINGNSIEEMFEDLKKYCIYHDDPINIELIQRPRTLFSNLNELGKPGRGDCDDFTTAALCAAMAYNYPARVVLAGRNATNPVHVYLEVYDQEEKRWIPFDLTAPELGEVKYYPYKTRVDVVFGR